MFRSVGKTLLVLCLALGALSSFSAPASASSKLSQASGSWSHDNGYKVDVAKGSCLDAYVKKSFGKIADRGDGYPQWRSSAGNTYCDEGNHWDISYV